MKCYNTSRDTIEHLKCKLEEASVLLFPYTMLYKKLSLWEKKKIKYTRNSSHTICDIISYVFVVCRDVSRDRVQHLKHRNLVMVGLTRLLISWGIRKKHLHYLYSTLLQMMPWHRLSWLIANLEVHRSCTWQVLVWHKFWSRWSISRSYIVNVLFIFFKNT